MNKHAPVLGLENVPFISVEIEFSFGFECFHDKNIDFFFLRSNGKTIFSNSVTSKLKSILSVT